MFAIMAAYACQDLVKIVPYFAACAAASAVRNSITIFPFVSKV